MAAIHFFSYLSCANHYESVDDDASVTRFTNLTLNKCLEYSKEWIKIGFESQYVAERFQSCVNQLQENGNLTQTVKAESESQSVIECEKNELSSRVLQEVH